MVVHYLAQCTHAPFWSMSTPDKERPENTLSRSQEHQPKPATTNPQNEQADEHPVEAYFVETPDPY